MNFRTASLNTTITTNGDLTPKSSGSTLVDFLYKVPVAEDATDVSTLTLEFLRDTKYSAALKLNALLYLRDIRNGLGIRDNFRTAFAHLTILLYEQDDLRERYEEFLDYIPEVGRWDDLVTFSAKTPSRALADPAFNTKVITLIIQGINHPDTQQLCAKWMPRKGYAAKLLASYLFPNSRHAHAQYRKCISSLSNTLEQKMAAQQWNDIDFAKLPSLALSKHKKAFDRNCPDTWSEYQRRLSKGEVKINAGAIYPHQIFANWLNDANYVVAEAQWRNCPLPPQNSRILVMADTSGSMFIRTKYGQVDHICCALSVFLAERLPEPFKNLVLNFSARPDFIELTQSNSMDKIVTLSQASWGMNTDFRKAYTRILEVAKANKLPQKEMPEYLLVFSDMQFDVAGTGKFPVDSIRESFESFGYRMPKLIFWNLVGTDTVPALETDDGVLLLSGFSIAILEQILLTSGSFTPESALVNILSDRYLCD